MRNARFIVDHIKYFLTAKTEYNIHSPFIYDFYIKVVCNKYPYKEYKQINEIQNQFFNLLELKSKTPVKTRKLFFRIARYYKPKNMLQWGNSRGINLQYLALGNKKGILTTFSSDDQLTTHIQNSFNSAGIKNINIFSGNVTELISFVSEQNKKIDLFLFSEFDHKTICQCLSFAASDSIFIIEDIHSNRERVQLWKSIQSQPNVKASIDLFHVGILFFKEELSYQNFVLRF